MKSLRASRGIVSSPAAQPSGTFESASKFSAVTSTSGKVNCVKRADLSEVGTGVPYQSERLYKTREHFNQNLRPTGVLVFLSGTIPISASAPV